MAVAFDAATESSAWTTTPDPFTFTHTPAGTPRAAVLYVFQAVDDTDDLDAMPSYGGTPFTHRLEIGGNLGGEPARVYVFFLDNVASGMQTVSIPHTATANTKIATVVTLTGAGPLFLADAQALASELMTATQNRTTLNTAGTAIRLMGIYSGLGAVVNLTPLAGMTAVSDHDFGANICRVDRETTPSTGFTIGYAEVGDDVAHITVAVSETEEVKPVLYRYSWGAATAHIGSYPRGAADDVLIGVFQTNGAHTVTTPTDWAVLDAFDGDSSMSSGSYYKEMTGAETGDFDFVTNVSTNAQGNLHLWHLPAALRDVTVPPAAVATGPTSSGTPDPAELTPSWGSAATFWFVNVTRDAVDGISSLGANYTTSFVYDAATTELASGWRQNTAASEDPPASTVATTDETFKTYTMGVKPAASDDVTGTGASTLDGVTSAGSGTFTPAPITGTGSSTLDGVTSAGAGTYTPAAITGTGASTLDGVTSAGSGTFAPPGVTGTGASTLDGVTSAGSGTFTDPITGTGASTLAGVTSAGVGFFGDIFLPEVTCELLTLGAACEVTVLPVACAILSLGVECEQ